MTRWALNPDKDCRLCSHAVKDDKYTYRGRIFCDIRKKEVTFAHATERGSSCNSNDPVPALVEYDRCLRQGAVYQATGDIGAFSRPAPRRTHGHMPEMLVKRLGMEKVRALCGLTEYSESHKRLHPEVT
jgi:hypothetical protein